MDTIEEIKKRCNTPEYELKVKERIERERSTGFTYDEIYNLSQEVDCVPATVFAVFSIVGIYKFIKLI